MMAPMSRAFPILALLIAAISTPAAAHDFCLLPESARSQPGDPLLLTMHVSDTFPGEAVAWRTGRIVDFFVTDVRGRWEVVDPVVAGDPARARITLRTAGTALVALSTDASYIELPAKEFEEYLKHEGHTVALETRRKSGRTTAPGRERYTRHVKTVINAAAANASVALTRAGLALEIVPEADLARLRPGDRLPVRLFYRGDPFIEGQVCATWAGRDGGHDTYAWCARSDGAGRALVPIEKSGWQMIRTSRMMPLRDDPKADWHSYWAALTFQVEEAPGGTTP